MFYPYFSKTAMIGGGIIIVLILIFVIVAKFKKWQYYLGLRLGIMALFFDCTMLFLALTISRSYNNILPAVILIILLALTIFLGHRFAEPIITEMKSPQTRIGRFIMLIGFLGSGIGALIGYLSVKTIGVHIAGPVVFMLFLILIGLVHANLQQVITEK